MIDIDTETCYGRFMALVIPEGYGSVIHSLVWSGDPEPMAVTYGVQINTEDPFSPSDVAATCAQAFVDNVLVEISTLITLVQTEVKFQVDAPPDPPLIGVSTISDNGSDNGNVLPQNSAYLAHKRTATGGRGGRGRFYLPGVLEGVVDNLGNIDGAKVTAINAALFGMLIDLSTGATPVLMVVLHDSEGAFAADPPRLVTTLTCDAVISTQRRRLRR